MSGPMYASQSGRCAARVLIPGLVPLLLAGCSGKVTTAEGDAPAEGARLILSEVFRIGEEASGDAVLFGPILGMAVNSVGHLFVADWNSESVHVFSDAGGLIGIVGSRGEGPGEFERASGIAIGRDDTVFVWDGQNDRLSAFEPGSHSFAYSVTVEANDFSNPNALIGVTDAGYLIRFTPPYWAPGSGTGLSPDAERVSVVKLVDRNGAIVGDPVATLPASEAIVHMSDDATSVIPLPFGRGNFFRWSSSGRLLFGWNETIAIAIGSTTGEVQDTVKNVTRAVSVTDRDVNAYLKGRSRQIRQIIRSYDLPKTKPAYDTFVVDDLERIWIKMAREAKETDATWVVLNAESVVVATAELPGSIDLKIIREGRAYGSGTTQSGEPFVAAYGLGSEDLAWTEFRIR